MYGCVNNYIDLQLYHINMLLIDILFVQAEFCHRCCYKSPRVYSLCGCYEIIGIVMFL